jgi:hypothetical protein
MAEPPLEVVDELYGAPPDEFIARRDAKAKGLRKQDRAAADAIKRLRKPSVSAAVVNRLARESADDVEALLAAGEALRQAQLGGGDRDAIRDAARDEREAVDRLVASVGKASESTLQEVRDTLHAAALDEEAREQIRRGVLTEARHAVGLGGFGIAAPPSRAPAAKKAEKPPKKKDDAKEKAAAEKQRLKEARAALKEAEQAAKTADRAVAAAERERDKAQKALDKAEREAEQAHAEVDRLREEAG